ncbi:MAG: YfiR family protein [Cytophagales bacterium]|nr:YfiR family protein [Cytophagales bacterium]
MVGGQTVSVELITSPADAKAFHMVFVPSSQSSKIGDTHSAIGNSSVLLVSEREGLINRGSHINLVIVDGKMKFELNKQAVEAQQLKVSGSLLTLAIVV